MRDYILVYTGMQKTSPSWLFVVPVWGVKLTPDTNKEFRLGDTLLIEPKKFFRKRKKFTPNFNWSSEKEDNKYLAKSTKEELLEADCLALKTLKNEPKDNYFGNLNSIKNSLYFLASS